VAQGLLTIRILAFGRSSSDGERSGSSDMLGFGCGFAFTTILRSTGS